MKQAIHNTHLSITTVFVRFFLDLGILFKNWSMLSVLLWNYGCMWEVEELGRSIRAA